MKELNLVLLGLVVLIIGLAVLLFFHKPEIYIDKELEVIVALGTGLLILMLSRRSDSKIHQVIRKQSELTDEIHRKLHEQHELIDEINRKLHEQHELIKRTQDTS